MGAFHPSRAAGRRKGGSKLNLNLKIILSYALVLAASLIIGAVALFHLESSDERAEGRRLSAQGASFALGVLMGPPPGDQGEARFPSAPPGDPESPFVKGLPPIEQASRELLTQRKDLADLLRQRALAMDAYGKGVQELARAANGDNPQLLLSAIEGWGVLSQAQAQARGLVQPQAVVDWLASFRGKSQEGASPQVAAVLKTLSDTAGTFLDLHTRIGDKESALSRTDTRLRSEITDLLGAPLEGGDALSRVLAPLAIAAAALILLTALLAHLLIRSNITPLTKITMGLDSSAGKVVETSRKLSRSSAQLAKGAADNTQAVLTAISSLETLLSMAKRNASNADSCKDLMALVKECVSEANLYMMQIAEAMTEIRDSGKASTEIIKSVEEIAFQTNILSLNAAVEAARAGEAGVSFAVVADEVRNLANKSRDAAKNTTSMLASSITLISEGSLLVDKAKESFTRLVDASDKVGGIVDNIALASKSQTGDIQDIHQSIALMDKVTQENALEAAETENFSLALNNQAGILKGAVQRITSLLQGARASLPVARPRVRRLPEKAVAQEEAAEPQEAIEDMESIRREEESKPKSSFKAKKQDLDQAFPMDDDF
ncbi:MAG: methyl-accepting chemotaxis protein [Deltaproteobacteria bacterium]|jgi:hypothetical protein|nr:methyl-accepting chemotaxis protein [Deltaproteobacteria bacterium]